MLYSSIELKSTKYVLTLIMDPGAAFDTILADTTDKFRKSARFFKGAQMALEFKGRELTDSQMRSLVHAISESCRLDIVCVIEQDEEAETAQYNVLSKALKDREFLQKEGQESADIVRGSVRNGQKIVSDRSILVLGDVEPLAYVSSSRSIFVCGCAMGQLAAGTEGDRDSFIAALALKPQMIRIGQIKNVSAIRKRSMDDSYAANPQICTLEDGHIRIDSLNGKTWSHLFERFSKRAKEEEENLTALSREDVMADEEDKADSSEVPG